ncbi:hypothetical protein Dimus_037883 [Dionaea muscipula]
MDDIVAKGSSIDGQFAQLKSLFERMREYGLKLNPLKCAFRVGAGNFLGFLVHKRGIEIAPGKASAILKAEPPRTKELQRFLGQINFLRCFIFNYAGRTIVFAPLLKLKDEDELLRRWGTRTCLTP